MSNAELRWQELMKCGKEDYSDRVKSDEIEREFWKKFIKDNRTIEDKYAKGIKDIILPELEEINCKTALEIGPGWGNYTFDIANRTEKMYCLDISEDIIKFILKKSKEKNVNNIEGINSKLEEANLQKYDFVFAYNCFYRMKNIIECLNKIINCSNKLSIIGMNSELDRMPTLEIEKKLNIDIKRHFLNHVALNDILLEMGIKTEIKELILDRSYDFNTLDEALNFEKGFILEDLDCKKEEKIKDILKQYYKYENGKYSYSHKIMAGLIFIK